MRRFNKVWFDKYSSWLEYSIYNEICGIVGEGERGRVLIPVKGLALRVGSMGWVCEDGGSCWDFEKRAGNVWVMLAEKMRQKLLPGSSTQTSSTNAEFSP
ncbi:hypothetical protein CFOL_v3_16838 [Cephalotus follicularis]|uniref:Uncharacterized protein n=1 Tax=Cephalotus follicularis TaxID=3775 RepID=A0A1Q3BZL7_CEPFO|nr:hypothetical protein CFOL_v3_16838 [Cephalotus follicularis]